MQRRMFMTSMAAAAGTLTRADTPQAPAMPTLTRLSAGTLRLDWRNWAAPPPVAIYAARQPDAPPASRRLLLTEATAEHATIHWSSAARPYLYLRGANGQGRWVAERELPLQGGVNFRDLGGYAAQGGRFVRWGKLYRSASMASLTPADEIYLGQLGIRFVCDLRDDHERAAAPNHWAAAAKLGYWSRDYLMDNSKLAALIFGKAAPARVTPAQMRAAMIELYAGMPAAQKPSFIEIFKELLRGDVPLAFNCTAGKDRSGLAAALILSALGVPYETVMADYLLSNVYFDAARIQADQAMRAIMARLSPAVAAPLIRVDPAYLNASFQAIGAQYGSVAAYLDGALGVGPQQITQLRAQLLDG